MRTASVQMKTFVSVAALLAVTSLAAHGQDKAIDMSKPNEAPVWGVVEGFPPLSATNDSGVVEGSEVDVAALLGEIMGVTPDVRASAFQDNMMGLQSGRVDIVTMGSINPERLETLDMVPYFKSGYGLVVQATAEDLPSDPDLALCGLTIGITAADPGIAAFEAHSAAGCGDNPVTITGYNDGAAIAAAVRSGRIDAWACPSMTCAYQAKLNPDVFKMTGPIVGEKVIGIASKAGSGWGPVIAAALKEAIRDGRYAAALSTYGLESFAVPLEDVEVLGPGASQ